MTDPYKLAQRLLELVANGLGEDAPTVRYVAPGLSVAYDGPQLTTNVTRIYVGQPGAEQSSFLPARPMPISCDIQTVVVRKISVVQESGDPPTVDQLNTDSRSVVGDMMTLRQILYDVLSEHVFVDNGVPVMLGAVSAIGPQGGVSGAAGTISVVIS